MNMERFENHPFILAPIVLFAFIRKETLEQTINTLKKNYLAKDSDLFIYIDGPRNENDIPLVMQVEQYCSSIEGFKSVSIRKNEKNKGLDPSVIDGVTEVINKYGKAIILEDDVITTSNFLNYMNQCLLIFENDKRIMSISGWGIDIVLPADYQYDAYLFGRSSSWGWATWKNRWKLIDWDIKDWSTFRRNRKHIKQFNKRGGSDMFQMLKKCMNGGNMWDIRFCYNMFKLDMYSIIPILSKTDNIGFNELATHCKPIKYKRFTITFDESCKLDFNISTMMQPDERIIKQRLRISSFYVILLTRLKNIISR